MFCQLCGIYAFAPQTRFLGNRNTSAIDWGSEITLCIPCHEFAIDRFRLWTKEEISKGVK